MANAQETLASWRAHPTLKLIVFDICLLGRLLGWLPACLPACLLQVRAVAEGGHAATGRGQGAPGAAGASRRRAAPLPHQHRARHRGLVRIAGGARPYWLEEWGLAVAPPPRR